VLDAAALMPVAVGIAKRVGALAIEPSYRIAIGLPGEPVAPLIGTGANT
jgi:hypothetical protein